MVEDCGRRLWSRVVVEDCGRGLWSKIVVEDCGRRLWSKVVVEGVWGRVSPKRPQEQKIEREKNVNNVKYKSSKKRLKKCQEEKRKGKY